MNLMYTDHSGRLMDVEMKDEMVVVVVEVVEQDWREACG